MNKLKLLSIILLLATFSNTSFSEEKAECKDIKKYFKRMACFGKAAKNKIGSAVTSSKKTTKKEAPKEETPTSETEEPASETKIEKSEKVECEDIKKYFKRMACFGKAAKNKIGSAVTSSKEGVNKVFKKDK